MKQTKNIDSTSVKLPILTERLRIRKLTREDFDNIYSLCMQSKSNDWPSGWNMSKEEASGFLDWQINKYERFDVINDMVPFAIELLEDSTFVGHCHVGSIDDLNETEVAYGISKQHRGFGYATEAAVALTKWTLETFNLSYVVATISDDNSASLKVIEKAGFSNCGKKELKNFTKERREFNYFRFYNIDKNKTNESTIEEGTDIL
ncbi:GNAT family N-acetyltransferase [Paenibacillus sp. FSL K6-2441]|uniref:GNAT family N-acetyltransferase n=1 Tax=Paenibacillus TaxID=44249 RepID=UPI0030DBF131